MLSPRSISCRSGWEAIWNFLKQVAFVAPPRRAKLSEQYCEAISGLFESSALCNRAANITMLQASIHLSLFAAASRKRSISRLKTTQSSWRFLTLLLLGLQSGILQNPGWHACTDCCVQKIMPIIAMHFWCASGAFAPTFAVRFTCDCDFHIGGLVGSGCRAAVPE